MNSTIGLDIGSHSIKLIELLEDKGVYTLHAAGLVPTPVKIMSSNDTKDKEAVAVAIKKLFSDAVVSNRVVNIALPESQVFTRVIQMPKLSERELASAIQWEAEQYVPLPLDQVSLDYSLLQSSSKTGGSVTDTGEMMDVLLVASPKILIEKYVQILELSDLTVSVAETEILAATRAMARTITSVKNAIILSLGAQTSDMAIVRNGTLAFTRSISAGGEALSRALSQGFGFEQHQAEEFKRTYGLEKDKLEGKIVGATKPIMDTIVGEMKRAIAFFQERYKEERVQVVLLSGGTARLPGIVVYMAEQLGIETQIANPFIGIKRDSRFLVLDAQGPTFTVAVGLALRHV
ncbi:type IV pilus assembly protein PilM [Candidatus Gottesmanbacteria bacterium]|nr:type IV pilus assembly protein PilM [Candidatus Gottesmanbacteria bacterium]